MAFFFIILIGFIGSFIAESVIYPFFRFWPLFLGFILGLIAGFLLYLAFIGLVSLLARLNTRCAKGKDRPFHLGTTTVYDFCSVALALSRGTVKTIGLEKLPKNGYLLVMNHQSDLDVMSLLATAHDRDLTFVMKESLARMPLVGRALSESGFIALDRSSARDGVRMIQRASERIAAGYPIAICPEGTRTKSPTMLPFHWGTFKIAFRAKCPVVLVCADGFWRMHESTPLVKRNVLKVIEVLPPSFYENLTSQQFADYCARRIAIEEVKLREEYPYLRPAPKELKKLQSEKKKTSFQ